MFAKHDGRRTQTRTAGHWLVRLSVVWLCATVTASAQTRHERAWAREMVAGSSAFEDGLYRAAQDFFEKARARSRTLEEQDEATRWLLHTLYQRQRYARLLEVVSDEFLDALPEALQPVYRFWRARALYANGQYTEAIAELETEGMAALPALEATQRIGMLGRASAAAGYHETALYHFQRFMERPQLSDEQYAANVLDWSVSLKALNRDEEAAERWGELIARYPDTVSAVAARLWQAVAWIERGELEPAESLLRAIIAGVSPPTDWLAEAHYAQGRIFEERREWEQAGASIRAGQAIAQDTAIRNRGRILLARVYFRLEQWAEGEELLRRCVAEMRGHPLAQQAQLELGEVSLDQERFDWALQAYQDYLEAFDDPAGRAQALLGRAWALLGLRRPLEAAASFEQAYALHPNVMERQQALFKLGDALFAAGNYARAREEYLLVTQAFPGSALIPAALFQAAECLARQGLHDQAIPEFQAIEDAFPASRYAEQAAMRIGGLHEARAEWDRAIRVYDRVMVGYPDGERYAEALHRRGLMRYRIGLFDQALSDFVRLVKDFPGAPEVEQAFYMRGWSLYLLGQNEEALRVCEVFLQRYPQSRWRTDVLFWLAAYHFNRGEYAEAEQRFSAIAALERLGLDWREQAGYWAGRAAMEQEEYLRAIEYFNLLARTSPGHPIMPAARFAQGDTLSLLGEFAGAILAFEEVIRLASDHDTVYRAWGRKGDCHFTLGADHPERYAEAATCFRYILESEESSPALKWQAEFKLGRSREKMGDVESALAHYLRVLYEIEHQQAMRGGEGMLWFTRAAFTAAALKETQGDTGQAVALLHRVIEADIPARSDAERRVERIRSRKD